MNGFTFVFLILLGTMLGLRLWLAARHIAHIARYRAAVPAEFAAHITLEAHQKAADYSIEKTRLSMVETLAEGAFLLFITLGGALLWIDALSANWLGTSYARGIVTIFAVMLLSSLLFLPFDLKRTFGIEVKYGFNKMTLGLYIADAFKGMVLALLIGVPLLLVTFWLIEKMGALWWLYVWLVWLGFSLFMLAVYPTFIAPLFNKFSPLENAPLKSRIENLLARCGFRSQGLFVMDGSKRSSHGNAYFTGFGKAKRIVFFDTLIERLNPEEIEAVLAHELGHFKRKHIAKLIVSRFAIALVVLAAMGWLIDKPWFYQGAGMGAAVPHIGVSVLVFFQLLPVFTFPLTPLGSLISRKHEFEADVYAIAPDQRTRPVDGLAQTLRGQRVDAHSRPDLRQVLLFPSARQREAHADGRLMLPAAPTP